METGAERKRLEGVGGRREKVEDGEGEGEVGGAKANPTKIGRAHV